MSPGSCLRSRIVSPVDHVTEEPVVEDGKPVFDEDGKLLMETVHSKRFRAATVFDISQTDGEPLPEIINKLKDPVEGFYRYLEALRGIAPVPVTFADIPQNGLCNEQGIVIKRGMSEAQTIKTLIHECAHAMLHYKGDGLDRRTREVQAESVAFCCCSAFGIDASEYSFGYIAGWSNELKDFKASLKVIRDTSNKIISEVESKLGENIEPEMSPARGRGLSL